MNEIIGAKSIAEWRFGSDIMDLYRSFVVSALKKKSSEKFIKYFDGGFGSKIDEIQSVLDKNHFCSEMHCVVEKI
jgi:hypothetical protein